MKNFCYIFLVFISLFSCIKTKKENDLHSSIKIIPSENGYTEVKMVDASNGNLLICLNSSFWLKPNPQQFKLIKPNGDIIKSSHLFDTAFGDIKMIKGIDGGFLICGSNYNSNYISLFKLDDDCNIEWSKNKLIPGGGSYTRTPSVSKGSDNNYLLLYEVSFSGCFIEKFDANGTVIFNKIVPKPYSTFMGSVNFIHTSDWNESVYQLNDSLVVIAGVSYNYYLNQLNNIFLSGLSQNIERKWYSENYDSTQSEQSTALFYSPNKKILLFGISTINGSNPWNNYGNPFVRIYSESGVFENEIKFPMVGGTSTSLFRIIKSSDGGYLMVGCNNGRKDMNLISNTRIALMKINPDLSVSWSKSFNTVFPSAANSVSYLPDGSIGLAGFIAENYFTNKLLYIHLDAEGNLINN